MGHEDAFPPHRPNAGYVIGKETVAWARGSGRDAPIAVVPAMPSKPRTRFYGGDPLRNEADSAIGTLCVMAKKPRPLGLHRLSRVLDGDRLVASDRPFRLLVFAANGEDP